MYVYENLYSSIIKVAQQIITDIRSEGVSANLEFINWDANVEVKTLPKVDLLGIRHFNVWPENGIIHCGVGFGVSTYEDTNLFRHTQIIARVFNAVKMGTGYRLVEALTGTDVTFMRVKDGAHVPPILQTDVRQIQFVIAEFGTGETA